MKRILYAITTPNYLLEPYKSSDSQMESSLEIIKQDEEIQKYLDKPHINLVEFGKKYQDMGIITNYNYVDNLDVASLFIRDNEDNIIWGVSFKQFNSLRIELAYFTLPQFQNKGYMKDFLNELLDELYAPDVGVNYVEVRVKTDNKASLAIIKSLGFTYRFVDASSHDAIFELEKQAYLERNNSYGQKH